MSMLSLGRSYAAPDCVEQDNVYTGEAGICWPIPEDRRVIVIDGPSNVWNLRVFADRLDRYLTRMHVRSGRCDFRTPGVFCIRVVKTYQPLVGWAGYTDWELDRSGVTIKLNTRIRGARWKRPVAAHEFMHALGFDHHGESTGLVSRRVTPTFTPDPSITEWGSLYQYYG